jgi:hypothetical protein
MAQIKEHVNLNELLNSLSDEESRQLYDQMLAWQNDVHNAYYKKFRITHDNTIKNFATRDELVKFIDEATKFWVSYTPVFKKGQPIDVLNILKSKYCVAQTSILFKRAPDDNEDECSGSDSEGDDRKKEE